MSIGIIYAIKSSHEHFAQEHTYIGSSFQTIDTRFKQHRDNYKTSEGKDRYLCRSSVLFDLYGIETCYIEKLAEFSGLNREQLNRIEKLDYISKLPCINRIGKNGFICDNTRDYNKLYYQKYRDKLNEYSRKKYAASKQQFKQDLPDKD